MALTIGTGPFARPPGGAFNFDIEHAAPRHTLYLEDVPKRIRGELAGDTIVDTRRGKMLFETGAFAQWYVPRDDVRAGVLTPSERRKRDPYKGETTFYDVRVGDRVETEVAWSFENPPAEAPPLAGLVAFKFDGLDRWLEEDEPIRGHPRDPYHRFDCRRTSERVVVRVGGQTVAETGRAIKLFETSIPPRYYVPLDDVMADVLTPTETRSYCPYKGEAAYYTVRAGETTVEDGAWALSEPLGEAVAAAGHVSFWGKGTEVAADGQATPI